MNRWLLALMLLTSCGKPITDSPLTGIEVQLEAGTRIPPGGIAVRHPFPAVGTASVNGQPVTPNAAGEILVWELPATVKVIP